MEVVILSKEQYNDMVERIEEIKKLIIQNSKENKDYFVYKQKLYQMLSIGACKRQTYQTINIFILVFKIIIDICFCN